jgi:hypothetical protein
VFRFSIVERHDGVYYLKGEPGTDPRSGERGGSRCFTLLKLKVIFQIPKFYDKIQRFFTNKSGFAMDWVSPLGWCFSM